MNVLKLLSMIGLLSALVACNQEEFYEKDFLEAAGKAPEKSNQVDNDLTEEDLATSDSDDSGVIVDNGNNSGGNDGEGNNDGDNTGGGNTCDASTWPVVSDGFSQAESQEGKIDVLWVMDDSGSMSDEQAALAFNFDAFINDFIDRQTDFRMAITTTDTSTSSKAGALKGQILTSADAQADENQFKEDFKDYIQVGINGSGNEKGLKGSTSFLGKHHQNFLREDAYLIVVYVSDEEDNSENSVATYLNTLRSYKSNAGLVKAYSIVNTETTSDHWESIGSRYISVSNQTSGTVSNIKNDFYQSLSQMGGDIIDLLDSFALSQAAVEDTIQVSVGGSVVATGWSFNSQNNSIKFDAESIPNPGTQVSVSYKVNTCQ